MSQWYEIRVFVKAGGKYDATMAGLLVDKALADYTRSGLSVVRVEPPTLPTVKQYLDGRFSRSSRP